ncbi:MAG: flagellar basal-body MS-ring/collar protein FliF [Candidatus Brocadiia bacterium]|jgi:flagellar M-ring protein FliF
MGSLIKQVTAIWNKLGINQKVSLLLVALGVIAGGVVLVCVARQPSYELLYSDLEEKDMAQVVGYLKDSKVPYQITAGGKALMVPEGQKYDLRIALANKGLMTGNRVGLELWEGPGWGTSPLAEQMMKRRAIQGELARTIMHIEQIAWADVQIAQAEASLFAEDQRQTTAAITLKLHPGQSLSAIQVGGIARLVAASVEGLDLKNVTVIDEQGNLLSSPHNDADSAEAADLQAFRRNCEEQLAQKAQVMLDRALGPGKSVVKISAIVDMDRITETKEQVDAANRVARTEKTTSKTSTAAGEGAAAAAGGGMSEETNETNYDVPKTVRTTQMAAGTIKHLDVAVIIDPSTTDKDGKDTALTPQQIEDLGMVVKRAVGFEETGATRKDSFQLTAMAFHKEPKADDAAAPAPEKGSAKIAQVAKQAVPVLAALIFVVFAGLSLRKILRSVPKPGASAPETGREALIAPEFYGGATGGDGHVQLRNRVKDVMAKDPEAAARLLQRWISEPRS